MKTLIMLTLIIGKKKILAVHISRRAPLDLLHGLYLKKYNPCKKVLAIRENLMYTDTCCGIDSCEA